MPTPTTPPIVALPQGVFDALNGMSYDSTARAFRDGSNNAIYLFVESDSNGLPRWQYATDAQGSINPRADIPLLTADVILGGTFDAQTGAISYDGQSYRIRLERDGSGPIAKAY
ncbi:MAG: hypothetical protein HYV09_31980 [Deltaproteobacteria bacterium]|nr:hypothetical protein [Deltaproteobacteria bacterium]